MESGIDGDVDMQAVEAAVATQLAPEKSAPAKDAKTGRYTKEGIPESIDKLLDDELDKIPDTLREGTGVKKREQPKAAEPAKAGDAPEVEGEEAEPEGEAKKPDEPKAPDYALEKALSALRFAKVPSDVIDNLGRAKLLSWGTELAEGQAKTAEKLRSQADELKRAQDTKSQTTEAKEPDTAAFPDLDTALQAFGEYGEDFKKPMGAFGRAAVKIARESIMTEIQPAVGVLSEMQGLMREMLNESMRRELGERFPKIVEKPETFEKVEAAFKRLWGASGESYQDAAPTTLGRVRAAWNDAGKLSFADDEAPRKNDSQRQSQRIPPSPARKVPQKPHTVDAMIEEEAEKALKKWEGR